VNISISNNSLYLITNLANGTYDIEFSTLYIDNVGINQLSINFSAAGYEPQYYIYQFQITKQSVDLNVYVNSKHRNENELINTEFNGQVNISAKAISNIDNEYLAGGVITFIGNNYRKNLTENINDWYNTSIVIGEENFSLGINIVYLKFEHPNYKTATFGFQLLINQIDINVDTIGFNDSINAELGEIIHIQIQLLDPGTNNFIENASITYSWDYGRGYLNETTPGLFQVSIKLPENLEGNFRFDLFITPSSSIYKSSQYSFIVIIGEPVSSGNPAPNILLWIIVAVLASIIGVLGVLSIRSYVILPRQRRKESDLLAKTQKFKDLTNIQAIVVIHRISGIPIYAKSYSILEKHKREMFSGFIQAITTIAEEFIDEKSSADAKDQKESYGIEKIIELDFKHFYCLIADKEDVRTVVILKERSSERLKSQVSLLMLSLNLKLSQELDGWDGSLDLFEEIIPPIINEYIELYYKDAFKLSTKINVIKLRKDKALSRMETRALNVILSYSEGNNDLINLNNIINLVSEENKDLIIEAIESLILKKMIVPANPKFLLKELK